MISARGNTYTFGYEYIKQYINEHENSSKWSTTQLDILLQAILISGIDVIIETCITNNDLAKCIFILKNLQEINTAQSDDKKFWIACVKSKRIENTPNWFKYLVDNVMGRIQRFCEGDLDMLDIDCLRLTQLQEKGPLGIATISAEQKKEVQQIIDDHLTKAINTLSAAYQQKSAAIVTPIPTPPVLTNPIVNPNDSLNENKRNKQTNNANSVCPSSITLFKRQKKKWGNSTPHQKAEDSQTPLLNQTSKLIISTEQKEPKHSRKHNCCYWLRNLCGC